ncbi:MAG TPA: hypothetical protein VE172_15015 [Stackebrandtia sp.]|jgi:hypothetical protein|uniref:hypothetical protein n=1 Tax=Stackebrandtia sp. TaxID=2023065 RepID=UPI002D7635B0|nr:hypothetical protein [Stackebrandtia sp.]HZE40116.1 hypothetical protein [Stackebrandtia sp.]
MSPSHDDDPDRARDSNSDGELGDKEVDERFAELISDFDDTPQWPDEDAEEADKPSPRPAVTEDEEPTLLELLDAEVPEDEDDEEEVYEPPPPAPMPIPSLPAVLGTLMVLGGLTLIISPGLLHVPRDLALVTGLAGFVGGVLMLIWRLRPEPEDGDDSGDDNGAVV